MGRRLRSIRRTVNLMRERRKRPRGRFWYSETQQSCPARKRILRVPATRPPPDILAQSRGSCPVLLWLRSTIPACASIALAAVCLLPRRRVMKLAGEFNRIPPLPGCRGARVEVRTTTARAVGRDPIEPEACRVAVPEEIPDPALADDDVPGARRARHAYISHRWPNRHLAPR
jgi:hypothetical protein